MEFTRAKLRSIKGYMEMGFSRAEAVKMRTFEVLGNLIFCEMTEEERYSEENEPLLKRYDDLMKELEL